MQILEEKLSSQGAPHDRQIAIQEALVELKQRLAQVEVGARDSNVMAQTWEVTSNVHQLLRDFPKGHRTFQCLDRWVRCWK